MEEKPLQSFKSASQFKYIRSPQLYKDEELTSHLVERKCLSFSPVKIRHR